MQYRLTIPVMHCFDDRYAAPAAVAFLSMLEHGAKDCFFKLYVLHSDITAAHQKMLHDVVSRFTNASLEFMVPKLDVDSMWAKVSSQCHYSKDLIYKLIAPDVFPNESHLMIMDVDCLYCDDISKSYEEFLSDVNYMAGHNGSGGNHLSWGRQFEELAYGKNFTLEEREKIKKGVNACYMIYNLEAMRRDGIAKKALDYFIENAWRISQPEQDTMNIVCAGKITHLPLRSVICTFLWNVLTDDEKVFWHEAMENPVQLHFPGPNKPWIEPSGKKAEIWWGYLARTPFFTEVASRFTLVGRKSNWSFLGKIPFLEIWSTGAITKVKLARILSLRNATPFWRQA